MRALVVDDSRAMRSILRSALEGEGAEVSEASGGREALGRLEQEQFDLVLLDWNMPVMSGYQLLKAIRERRALDRTIVMMVTTETEPNQIVRALLAGANEYVMKPFTSSVLRDKLRALGVGGAEP